MVFGKNFAAATQGAPRRKEEAEGKRTGKSPGPEGKRKRRARNHPERDGDKEKETENRARERDAQYLTPAIEPADGRAGKQTASTKAQSEAVTETKGQCTVNGASRPLAGQAGPHPAPMATSWGGGHPKGTGEVGVEKEREPHREGGREKERRY